MRPAPSALYSTGPTIGRLRAEIEAATGWAFGPIGGSAVAAVWGPAGARARLPCLPGPAAWPGRAGAAAARYR